jgi:hypothetical protein
MCPGLSVNNNKAYQKNKFIYFLHPANRLCRAQKNKGSCAVRPHCGCNRHDTIAAASLPGTGTRRPACIGLKQQQCLPAQCCYGKVKYLKKLLH